MALTVELLRGVESDSDVLQLLFDELAARLPAELHSDLDRFVIVLRGLPPGLRAMAATYQLDVSLTLDDLGWHFANWPHRGYVEETRRALRELELDELAEPFEVACTIVDRSWEALVVRVREGHESFRAWYETSDLCRELTPLSNRMGEQLELDDGGAPGIFRHWVAYARRRPERVVG